MCVWELCVEKDRVGRAREWDRREEDKNVGGIFGRVPGTMRRRCGTRTGEDS